MTEELVIVFQGKYFFAVVQEEKPKTKVYAILPRSHYDRIGIVKWYPQWRQYCFFPENETVWSRKCLEELAGFINDLMEKRKK
jgi:hypothetical protein